MTIFPAQWNVPRYLLGFVLFLTLFAIPMASVFAEVKTFNRPTGKGARIDWCLNWARDCGKPAANAFCRKVGYSSAKSWKVDSWLRKTYVMGSNKYCNGSKTSRCDGFASVTCQRKGGGGSSGGGGGVRSGKIIAKIEKKYKCKYRTGGQERTRSNYLCRIKYSVQNTTGKSIAWSSGIAETQNPWGGGSQRRTISWLHDLKPGEKMILNNDCIIPHGSSIGSLSLNGSGRYRGDSNKHRFKWRLMVKCP